MSVLDRPTSFKEDVEALLGQELTQEQAKRLFEWHVKECKVAVAEYKAELHG